MSDPTDTPDENSGDELRATSFYVGSDAPPCAAPDESLQPYIEKIEAMDPFKDVPGVGKIAAISKPFNVSIETLPPEIQGAIRAQLRALPEEERQSKENELVTNAAKALVYSNRGKTGVGAAALPYHKEMASIAADREQLDRQIAYLEGELEAVRDHETVFNPETGKKEAKPIMRVDGLRRRNYEANIRDLQRQRRLLDNGEEGLGIEGAKRVQAALIESAKFLQRIDQEREDALEVERLVKERARKDRIDKRVEARLNLMRNGDDQ